MSDDGWSTVTKQGVVSEGGGKKKKKSRKQKAAEKAAAESGAVSAPSGQPEALDGEEDPAIANILAKMQEQEVIDARNAALEAERGPSAGFVVEKARKEAEAEADWVTVKDKKAKGKAKNKAKGKAKLQPGASRDGKDVFTKLSLAERERLSKERAAKAANDAKKKQRERDLALARARKEADARKAKAKADVKPLADVAGELEKTLVEAAARFPKSQYAQMNVWAEFFVQAYLHVPVDEDGKLTAHALRPTREFAKNVEEHVDARVKKTLLPFLEQMPPEAVVAFLRNVLPAVASAKDRRQATGLKFLVFLVIAHSPAAAIQATESLVVLANTVDKVFLYQAFFWYLNAVLAVDAPSALHCWRLGALPIMRDANAPAPVHEAAIEHFRVIAASSPRALRATRRPYFSAVDVSTVLQLAAPDSERVDPRVYVILPQFMNLSVFLRPTSSPQHYFIRLLELTSHRNLFLRADVLKILAFSLERDAKCMEMAGTLYPIFMRQINDILLYAASKWDSLPEQIRSGMRDRKKGGALIAEISGINQRIIAGNFTPGPIVKKMVKDMAGKFNPAFLAPSAAKDARMCEEDIAALRKRINARSRVPMVLLSLMPVIVVFGMTLQSSCTEGRCHLGAICKWFFADASC